MHKKINIIQRTISYGERVNLKRLQALQRAKDKRRTIRARKLAKRSTELAEQNEGV